MAQHQWGPIHYSYDPILRISKSSSVCILIIFYWWCFRLSHDLSQGHTAFVCLTLFSLDSLSWNNVNITSPNNTKLWTWSQNISHVSKVSSKNVKLSQNVSVTFQREIQVKMWNWHIKNVKLWQNNVTVSCYNVTIITCHFSILPHTQKAATSSVFSLLFPLWLVT